MPSARSDAPPDRAPCRLLRAPIAVALVALAFVQLERGLGDPLRSLAYVAHDLAAWVALAVPLHLASRRPWTAAGASFALLVTLHAASDAKVRAVLMPIEASDLGRLLDAWPVVASMGGPVFAGALAALAVIALAAWLEPPVRPDPRGVLRAGLLLVPALCTVVAVHRATPATGSTDMTWHAPRIATFLRSAYHRPDFRDVGIPALAPHCCFHGEPEPPPAHGGATLPNLVVVLQESTFPPQHLRGVAPVANRLFDGAAPLQVDTVGGGTWVAEYAVFHGISPKVYGRDHLRVLTLGSRYGLRARLAPMLERVGYRSIAILPFARGLLDGATMYRSLGLRRVLDCHDVEGCRSAPDWMAVPDAALYDRALDELRAAHGPSLVYLPTIRQHSPHTDRWPVAAHRTEVLDEYLRRLDRSGRELDAFLGRLGGLARPTLVLVFGDHVPAHVNEAFGDADFAQPRTRTFFNLYDARGCGVAERILRGHPGVAVPHVAYLDALLLREAGFSGPWIERKLALMDACGGDFCLGAEALAGTHDAVRAASLGQP